MAYVESCYAEAKPNPAAAIYSNNHENVQAEVDVVIAVPSGANQAPVTGASAAFEPVVQQAPKAYVPSDYLDFDSHLPPIYRKQPSKAKPSEPIQNAQPVTEKELDLQELANDLPLHEAKAPGNLDFSAHDTSYFAPPPQLKKIFAAEKKAKALESKDVTSQYAFEAEDQDGPVTSVPQFTADYNTIEYIPGFSPPHTNREIHRRQFTDPIYTMFAPVATENIYNFEGAVPKLQKSLNANDHASHFYNDAFNTKSFAVLTPVDNRSSGHPAGKGRANQEEASVYLMDNEKPVNQAQVRAPPTPASALDSVTGSPMSHTNVTSRFRSNFSAHNRTNSAAPTPQKSSCSTASNGPSFKYQSASPSARTALHADIGGYAFRPVMQSVESAYQYEDLNRLASCIEVENQ